MPINPPMPLWLLGRTPSWQPSPPAAATPDFDLTLVGDLVMGSRTAHSAIPATSPLWSPAASAQSQLEGLAARYGIAQAGNVTTWQKAIVRALVTDEARKAGIPARMALAVAQHESGMRMWQDVATGKPMQNRNIRNGQLHSTDYGVMQINDHAHRKQFPQVSQDVEANVHYGVTLLARIYRNYGKDLGLGLGKWDGALAVYGLGHLPKTEKEWAWTRRMVGQYHRILAELP